MCAALRDQCLVSLLKLRHRHGGILLFLHVPVLVCAILAIIGTLGGIASLLLGKGGALPAAVAIGTGLMCVLTFAVENAAK